MIRHVPEGIVPFENCGYARIPAYPFIGQEIRLDCLCDSETAPVLEFDHHQVETPVASSFGEGRWRFTIPAFLTAQSMQYRFVCGKGHFLFSNRNRRRMDKTEREYLFEFYRF